MIMFIQYNVNNSVGIDWTTEGKRAVLLWLLFEILASYSYILSAMLYLAYISLKGMFKNDQQYTREDRYKFDALEYYSVDVDWFAFIVICFNLDVMTATGDYQEFFDAFYPGTSASTSKEHFVLYVCVALRIFQFALISRFRDNNLRLITYPQWVWLVQIIGYVALTITILVMPGNKRIVRGIIYVDILMFIM